jgi:hypothetical protein
MAFHAPRLIAASSFRAPSQLRLAATRSVTVVKMGAAIRLYDGDK